MFGYNTPTDQIIPREGEEKQVSFYGEKKKRNLYYAAALERLHEYNKADRVRDCATKLTFATTQDGKTHLIGANFCRERLCPICVYNRSREIFRELSRVLAMALESGGYQCLMLTLTVKSVKAAALQQTLADMFASWNRFASTPKTKATIDGWFRGLELTYNPIKDTYHPHFHVLLLVKSDYFKGKSYRKTEEWAKAWQRAARLDYLPVTDVRAIHAKGKTVEGADKTASIKAAVKEAAKYTTKDTDYLPPDVYGEQDNSADKQLTTISAALKGRRLYAYGGTLKIIAAAVSKERKAENAQLIDDINNIITTYRWVVGFRRYVRNDKEARENG